jgi:CRISPR-associated protein Cas6
MDGNGREMVDVAFGLTATMLPADYEWPLFRAVAGVVPWISEVEQAGIHPLRGTRNAEGDLLLPQRAKLVVRMPRERVCAASALEGTVLDLGGVTVRVGQGNFKRLGPSSTLYSPRVVTGDDDEAPFAARLTEELARLGIARPFVCGRRAMVRLPEGPATAFSVAVHGLGDAASLLLQSAGIGRGRAIGCGLFVPHKVIEAIA